MTQQLRALAVAMGHKVHLYQAKYSHAFYLFIKLNKLILKYTYHTCEQQQFRQKEAMNLKELRVFGRAWREEREGNMLSLYYNVKNKKEVFFQNSTSENNHFLECQ